MFYFKTVVISVSDASQRSNISINHDAIVALNKRFIIEDHPDPVPSPTIVTT